MKVKAGLPSTKGLRSTRGNIAAREVHNLEKWKSRSLMLTALTPECSKTGLAPERSKTALGQRTREVPERSTMALGQRTREATRSRFRWVRATVQTMKRVAVSPLGLRGK
jgi:hypothetical protein